jgi:ABC-type antimicrobial peptide transport system permease subunit
MTLALAFGVLGLFLAAVGIYGVLAYLVARRKREIGIRLALGSTQAGIVKLVLREGFVLLGIGLLLGVAGAVFLRPLIKTQIYGIGPLDPLVIVSVAIVFGVIVLAACVMPARRAVQVDPAIVLSEA